MFVVDASVSGAWYLPDESDPLADTAALRLRTESAIVPELFWFELRNIFLIGERRGRISEADTARFLSNLARLPIAADREPNEIAIFQLARTHKLSFYDATYLELAQRKNAPIATLDSALVKAAKTEKVQLLGATR
jgi:predicted nucleic acid-binding protein